MESAGKAVARRWGWAAFACFALSIGIAGAALYIRPAFDDYVAMAYVLAVAVSCAGGLLALVTRNAHLEAERLEAKEVELREETLATANEILTAAMESSPDGILAVDVHDRIISFNRRFAALWGLPEDLVAARDDLAVLPRVMDLLKDPDVFRARVDYLNQHRDITSHEEIELKDGRIFDRHSNALFDSSKRYLGRIWFMHDITDERRAAEGVQRQAREDALTGLPNRRVFVEAVRQSIARATRGGRRFAVLYLDLDHFKDVNDSLGHAAGDLLLKEVGARLVGNLRATDIAARFGGDEFAVLQADVDDPAATAILARKLNLAIETPFMIDGHEVKSGASIGIAIYDQDVADAAALIGHADTALYRAKAEGRHTFRFFTPKMDREVNELFGLANGLRAAIAESRLELDYQPQVEIETGKLIGLGALARWNDPARGSVDPEEFVRVADKSGLAASLGRFVLRAACRQGRQWLDMGIAPPTLWIKISALQCKAPLEVELEIEEALAAAKLPHDRLGVEIDESCFAFMLREHGEVMRRLRARGLKFAIADFGAGFSSLDRLRRYPVDQIKIGRDYISRIATDPDEAAIVKAAVTLARVLGIEIVAVGVETEQQTALLQSWGCHRIQGYFAAKPMGPIETGAWLEHAAAA